MFKSCGQCNCSSFTRFVVRFGFPAFALVVLLAPGCERPAMTSGVRRPGGAVSLVGKTVVVDAGHGGKDTGAPGVGPMREKRVNLAIAQRVSELLRRRGVKVVMTRRTDRFVPLDERAAMAERTEADLFLSIHADAAPNPNATGATMYVATNALEASRIAAKQIDISLTTSGIKTRGVRSAGFRVLVGHSRPSVLVECGYLTNRMEASKLGTREYQNRVAGAIAEGVVAHLGAVRSGPP